MKNKLFINLQMFAEGAGEKTEKATPKKRQDARKKGQVLQSKEITSALLLILVFATLRIYGGTAYRQLQEYTTRVFIEYPKAKGLYDLDGMSKMFIEAALVAVKVVAPMLFVAALAGVISGYAQVGFLFTTKAIAFKLDKLNPISGFKRIFSVRSVVELLKSIFKITVIGYISYSYVKGEVENVLGTMDMNVDTIASYIGITCVNLALRISAVLVILAIIDYGYQWWEYEKNLKMSKQEVKEEYKQIEGNPEVKSKIKQRQRQISMRRMLQDVPKADVVITNPTHYAVAIVYDADTSSAPKVLAKGQDYMALRIKDMARENEVEIVENKQLARTIYETVEIGGAIPPELYKAVAEILAYVYSIKQGHSST